MPLINRCGGGTEEVGFVLTQTYKNTERTSTKVTFENIPKPSKEHKLIGIYLYGSPYTLTAGTEKLQSRLWLAEKFAAVQNGESESFNGIVTFGRDVTNNTINYSYANDAGGIRDEIEVVDDGETVSVTWNTANSRSFDIESYAYYALPFFVGAKEE